MDEYVYCAENVFLLHREFPKLLSRSIFITRDGNVTNSDNQFLLHRYKFLKYLVNLTGSPCQNYVRPRLKPREYYVPNPTAAKIALDYFVPENIIFNTSGISPRSVLLRCLAIFINNEFFGPLFYHVIKKFGDIPKLRGIFILKSRTRHDLYWKYTLHLDCGGIHDLDARLARKINFWNVRRNLEIEKVGDKMWKLLVLENS